MSLCTQKYIVTSGNTHLPALTVMRYSGEQGSSHCSTVSVQRVGTTIMFCLLDTNEPETGSIIIKIIIFFKGYKSLQMVHHKSSSFRARCLSGFIMFIFMRT